MDTDYIGMINDEDSLVKQVNGSLMMNHVKKSQVHQGFRYG